MEPNADGREHPTPEELHRFLSDSATREERRRIATHLLRGCESCASILGRVLKPEAPAEGAYGEILARFMDQLMCKLIEMPASEESAA